MKEKVNNQQRGGIRRWTAIATALLGGALASAAPAAAKADAEPTVIVSIEDIHARADVSAEWVREDILRSAFYESAEKAKWLGEYEFQYNSNLPDNTKGALEFTVLHWRRSMTNFYECTVQAQYRDADGEVVNLGTFHGTESGIGAMTRYDVADLFESSAEEAFRQALAALDKRLSSAA